MDEQRLQAYLNLIQSLLNCSSGEENQILQANSELVDAGLVQVMQLVAENQREEGNENAANFLTNLANQLAEWLKKSSANSQLRFLMQLLQATQDSDGDPNVIYPLMRDNINLINDNLAAIFQDWAWGNLPNLDSQEGRFSLMVVVGTFSDSIAQFTLGSRASNLEVAIAGYELALTVFTHQEYAEIWAGIQNSLANAYRDRIRGEKADNLEMAISAYQAVLSVFTREAFPQDWAMIQNNLAAAYINRIRGEKADNLEMAISACQAAFSVCTREAFPQEWAMIQNTLGIAYSDRIRGEKADNLEMAISAFQAALSVRTREAFPQDWA
ncbi:tetratricopeptide repeat protein, partial [Microcoleus sp. B4-D4]